MTSDLRFLTEQEKRLIQRLVEKGLLKGGEVYKAFTSPSLFVERFRVRYSTQKGEFTVCALLVEPDVEWFDADMAYGRMFIGASRPSIKDRPRRLTGELLALKRAILSDRGGMSILCSAPSAASLPQPIEPAGRRKGKKADGAELQS